MEIAQAVGFLQRKLERIIEYTWSVENEDRLRGYWPRRLAALDPAAVTLAELREVDVLLDKAITSFVLREDREELREELRNEFGLVRLTAKEIKQASPGSLPADWVEYKPGSYPAHLISAPPSPGVPQQWVRVTATSVRDLAEIYAHFSGKRVWVSQGLADRQNPQPGIFDSISEYVLHGTRSSLERLNIKIEPKAGGIVVLHEIVEAVQQEAEPERTATQAEIDAARAAMSREAFWAIIAEANEGGFHVVGTTSAVSDALERLSPVEILGFHSHLAECDALSYRRDLWAVAYIMHGGCSDDGFTYFRWWLIVQGREIFETALSDPGSVADHVEDGQEIQCYGLGAVALLAYEEKTGKRAPGGWFPFPARASGEDWREEDLPRLYPKLARRFGGEVPRDEVD